MTTKVFVVAYNII